MSSITQVIGRSFLNSLIGACTTGDCNCNPNIINNIKTRIANDNTRADTELKLKNVPLDTRSVESSATPIQNINKGVSSITTAQPDQLGKTQEIFKFLGYIKNDKNQVFCPQTYSEASDFLCNVVLKDKESEEARKMLAISSNCYSDTRNCGTLLLITRNALSEDTKNKLKNQNTKILEQYLGMNEDNKLEMEHFYSLKNVALQNRENRGIFLGEDEIVNNFNSIDTVHILKNHVETYGDWDFINKNSCVDQSFFLSNGEAITTNFFTGSTESVVFVSEDEKTDLLSKNEKIRNDFLEESKNHDHFYKPDFLDNYRKRTGQEEIRDELYKKIADSTVAIRLYTKNNLIVDLIRTKTGANRNDELYNAYCALNKKDHKISFEILAPVFKITKEENISKDYDNAIGGTSADNHSKDFEHSTLSNGSMEILQQFKFQLNWSGIRWNSSVKEPLTSSNLEPDTPYSAQDIKFKFDSPFSVVLSVADENKKAKNILSIIAVDDPRS
jgi:hypothetical protein